MGSARQYTGRIVTVSNSTVFDTPVYNYTRISLFVGRDTASDSYKDDRHRVEQILLDVANRHTVEIRDISDDLLKELRRRYFMSEEKLEPRVYWRLTDNWIELTVRFIAPTHGIRRSRTP